MSAEELANLIESNPDCVFEIDNDCWFMSNKDREEIAENTRDNNGRAIMKALIVLLNQRGFNIKAEAV